MNHPLQGAVLRTKWAKEHIRALHNEIAAWPQDRYAEAFSQHFDPDTNKITITIAPSPRFPSRWGRLASEVAFNLRSALDYVAWELAKWNIKFEGRTDEPFQRTQFPISTEQGQFQGDQVRDLHATHIALIKWLQPNSEANIAKIRHQHEELARQYLPGVDVSKGFWNTDPDALGAAAPLGHPFGRLVAINDHDKHRSLRPVASKPTIREHGPKIAIDGTIGPYWAALVGKYEVGTQIAEVDIIDPRDNPEVMMGDWITPTIAFGEDDILGEFPWMYRSVRDVIKLFWPVFL